MDKQSIRVCIRRQMELFCLLLKLIPAQPLVDCSFFIVFMPNAVDLYC